MMKAQGILAVATTISALLVGVDIVSAQPLPPLYGPPAYEAMGAYPPMPPRYVRGTPVPPYDDALLPQEIAGILQSTGYDLLGAPLRRGRFYVVAATNPDGVGGRVTIDAFSGRFMGFAPGSSDRGAMPAPVATAPGVAPPRGLRPPANVPRAAASAPIPAPKPAQLAARDAGANSNPAAPAASSEPAATPNVATASAATAQTAAAPVAKPADTKPAVQLRPTQPLPPVQPLE